MFCLERVFQISSKSDKPYESYDEINKLEGKIRTNFISFAIHNTDKKQFTKYQACKKAFLYFHCRRIVKPLGLACFIII